MLPRYTCNRCGKSTPQRVEVPKTCSKCKSPYWNKERKLKKQVSTRLFSSGKTDIQ